MFKNRIWKIKFGIAAMYFYLGFSSFIFLMQGLEKWTWLAILFGLSSFLYIFVFYKILKEIRHK